MNARLLANLSAPLFMALASCAQAQTGFYLGGSVGQSHYKEQSPLTAPLDDATTGFKAYVGYAFSPGLAVELGHADLGRFHAGPDEQHGQGTFVDAVTTVPLAASGWSALGRVGVFDVRSRQTVQGRANQETKVNVKLGMGLQYQLTPTVTLRGEWERYGQRVNQQTANTDLYSLGVLVQF